MEAGSIKEFLILQKNPLGSIKGALGGTGIKFPSVGDILKTIKTDLHIPNFKIPSAGDILKFIQTSLHIPNFKIPTSGQILSWIQDHIPKLNWKIPTLGDILNWIRSHIPKLNWKIPTLGDILSWIRSRIPNLGWHIPSAGDILSWIKGKIHSLSWSIPSAGAILGGILSKVRSFVFSGPSGGILHNGVNAIHTAYDDAKAIANAVSNPVQTASNIGNSIVSAVTDPIGTAKKGYKWLKDHLGPGISRARGPIDMLKGAMAGMRYENYPGHKKSIAQVIKDGAANCVDLTITGMSMAGKLGLPSTMIAGTWNGGGHIWGEYGGQTLDFARKALDNTYVPPARGPNNESSSPIIVQNIFKGPVYGLPDFEDQVEDKTIKALNKHLGGIL